jgi:hypothetical protein
LSAPGLGREIDNSALKELLERLQGLAYDADDVLDELDYFRIQDQLDGTFDAADKHAKGFVSNLALNAKAVGKQIIICLPACMSPAAANNRQEANGGKARLTCFNASTAVGKCFPCSSLPSESDGDNDTSMDPIDAEPAPELIFNRVDASKRMHDIVKQLRHAREIVSNIITTLGSNSWSTAPNIAESRPATTSQSIEPTLYGRDRTLNSIIHDITKGKHSVEHLTVIPILGVGGIGKTTLAQHIYHSEEVQQHFIVKVWKCASLNFSANNLIQDIEKYIPKVNSENSTSTVVELIGQRLKHKRFLLVLDDVWDCSNEDEWERLLVPFKKSQVHGNIIIATTRRPEQAQIMIRKIDHPISLHGLEPKEFQELFLAIVFGNDHQSIKDHTDLLQIGDKIACKLKGSPLAAKTVGRLLKTQLDTDHWSRVLESKEWERKQGKDDIMPALKLSYDYLPLHLKQCFSFCALFPQDYKFEQEELINFWIGLDVLHSSPGENKRVEDIGLSHLTELVNHGFFEKAQKKDNRLFFFDNEQIETDCYILHDLLHELARKVSSHECLSIDSSQSQVRSLSIPPSIRHLSINIDNSSVKDRLIMKKCVDDFSTLDECKFEKLRTLMLFGKNHDRLVKVVFRDLFREAKALRVVYLSETSYDVEDLLQNFYNLVHLRYLWIQSSDAYMCILDHRRFRNKLSRFHHMIVLHAKQFHVIPRDMSNLVKLRHFHVHNGSSVAEVGKLKSLQELRTFCVKQEGPGFELRQIGKLVELCGSLRIAGLENIQVVEEADEAKLMHKSRLHELILCWHNICQSNNNIEYSTLQEHVLERLEPSSSLKKLSVQGNGGHACPSWLGTNLSIKNLESLCLDGVAWKTFPPIGELWLVNMSVEKISSRMPEKRFENLRRLELKKLPQLKRWVVHAPCQLFPSLEVIDISHCSNLVELSFSHSTCCQQHKFGNVFRKLSLLKIESCAKLYLFPILPWTNEATFSIHIKNTGSWSFYRLVCGKGNSYPYSLTMEGNDTPNSACWDLLAFHNLTKLKEFHLYGCQPPPLHQLQKLSSLRKLSMSCWRNAFPFVKGASHVEYRFPVEWLRINQWNASGNDLTQLLSYFPKLSYLSLTAAKKITGLVVMAQELEICDCPAIPDFDESGRPKDGLPSSLQKLVISNCPRIQSLPMVDNLPSSLKELDVEGCGSEELKTQCRKLIGIIPIVKI